MLEQKAQFENGRSSSRSVGVRILHWIGSLGGTLFGGRTAVAVAHHIRFGFWKVRLGSLGKDSLIHSNVTIQGARHVQIGERCSIVSYTHIWGGGGVVIGNDVLIASHTVITSQAHSPNARLFRESTVAQPVVIENNVWIGAGAIILPGVRIKTGAIVAAGSVVRRDVERSTMVAGVPARAIRRVDVSEGARDGDQLAGQ